MWAGMHGIRMVIRKITFVRNRDMENYRKQVINAALSNGSKSVYAMIETYACDDGLNEQIHYKITAKGHAAVIGCTLQAAISEFTAAYWG